MAFASLLTALNSLRSLSRPADPRASAAYDEKKRARHAARLTRTRPGKPTDQIDALLEKIRPRHTPQTPLAKLQGEQSALRVELAAAKVENAILKVSRAGLEARQTNALKDARAMLASLPIDFAAYEEQKADPTGTPATAHEFITNYRRIQAENSTAEASTYYTRHGAAFGF